MAMSGVGDRDPARIARELAGPRPERWLSSLPRGLHALFFTALGWVVLTGLFVVSFAAFSVGIALAGRFPAIFSIPHSRIASTRRRHAFTRR